MNVLVVTHGLAYGGAQVSTFELLRVIKNNVNVQVITCSNANSNYIRDLESLGLRICKAECVRHHGHIVVKANMFPDIIKWADIVWITDEAYLTASKIKKIRNVPVVAHLRSYALICPWWSACYGMREVCTKPCNAWRIIRCKQKTTSLRIKLGIKPYWRNLIYSVSYFIRGPIDYAIWFRRSRQAIKNIDAYIALSKAVRNTHIQHIPSLREKPLKIMYNPVGIPQEIKFKPYNFTQNEAPKIMYAEAFGALHKGPHIFLNALKILLGRNIDFEAVMVGCKGTWIEEYAQKLGVKKNIVFYKKLPRIKVCKLMLSSSLVVVPSIWPEPLGRVAIEANYLGIPVVASNIGGLPEVVEDGITGYLVEPNNPKALAEGIVKALSTKFSRNIIHKITMFKFSEDAIKTNFLEFTQKLVR